MVFDYTPHKSSGAPYSRPVGEALSSVSPPSPFTSRLELQGQVSELRQVLRKRPRRA